MAIMALLLQQCLLLLMPLLQAQSVVTKQPLSEPAQAEQAAPIVKLEQQLLAVKQQQWLASAELELRQQQQQLAQLKRQLSDLSPQSQVFVKKPIPFRVKGQLQRQQPVLLLSYGQQLLRVVSGTQLPEGYHVEFVQQQWWLISRQGLRYQLSRWGWRYVTKD